VVILPAPKNAWDYPSKPRPESASRNNHDAHRKEVGLVHRLIQSRVRISSCVAVALLITQGLAAQVTPAAGVVPVDNTPSIKVGMTIFTDYTFSSSPKIRDANGDSVSLSEFAVRRAYVNVTGNISHLMAFRITPDISRETGAGASLSGSLEFRLKYAFGQLNLDDWMPRGTWIRFGIQQTPWVDFQEGIYRYRFQGTVFSEREGYLSSSDAGISAHYNLPSNYGDLHAGIYNGETYSKAEVNNKKAAQVRFSLRPFATSEPILRGFRAHVFYDGDSYVADAPRTRLLGGLTFEHANLVTGAEYLNTRDQTLRTAVERKGKGYSVFATPRTTNGWELLARYENITPDDAVTTQKRKRSILGISYWLPHEGSVSSSWLLDVETTTFDGFTPAQPTQRKIALHGLIAF
jgi:hypothetical protein